MDNRKEVEIFYRGLAMAGLLAGGWEDEASIVEVSKSLARKMMTDPKEDGIAAITPTPRRKYARK